MRFNTLNRRLFLRGAGGAMLALPWLPSLLPRSARAQASAVPRRFIAIKTYNGTPVLDWYPRQAPAGYQTHAVDGTVALSQALPEATGRHSNGEQYFGRGAPLSDFAGTGLSNIFGTQLNPHLDMMLLFRGLDFMPGMNHNYGGYLGNFGLNTPATGGPVANSQINATMDYVMSRSANVYPTAPIGPRVLHVGSRNNTSSYAPRNLNDPLAVGTNNIEQAQAFTNPRTAFNTVFASVTPDPSPSPGVSPQLVDRVIDDYRRVWSGNRLSAADRQVLDRHITHLVELEQRVNVVVQNACQLPNPPTTLDTGGEFNVNVADVTALFETFVDIIALAIACDVTRIITLDVTKMVINDSGDVFGMGDSENANSAGRGNWHFQAHQWDDDAKRWLGQGAAWVANSVVLRLLNRLREVQDEDGQSLLHHSLVMWSNELSFNHLNYSIPTVTWGQLGGYLNTGRYLDYVDHDRPIRFRQHDGSVVEGVQFNRLLATVMQGMGMTPDEYERVPGQGFGEYRTIDKDDGFAKDYDDSNVGEPLPSIRA